MSMVVYVTKDEVYQVIKEWSSRRKEDLVFAVKNIPATKVKRSRRLAPIHVVDGEEWCPHCRRKLRFYDVIHNPPRYCYCMWCGGALDRLHGNKNGNFDYELLKDRPPVENELEYRPTLQQIKFARAISGQLKIPLPETRTIDEYWKFINEHQREYYQSLKKGGK